MAVDEKNIKVIQDIKSLEDRGFNKYLSRTSYGKPEEVVGGTPRYISARNLSGGRLSSTTTINLGSDNIKIDGGNRRIVISDGSTDRILIGYQKDGF